MKDNFNQILFEIKSLSEDNIIKTLIVSTSIGESVDKYMPDFIKIRDGISDCNKIQVIDADGKVIFSTLSDEINSQRVKAGIVKQLNEYFSVSQDFFNYFLDKDQFVSIYPISPSISQGFIAIYYKSSRLLKGMSSNNLSIPFSFDNFVFLSSSKVDNNDINKIINYYNNPVNQKKEAIDPTIGSISQFNGIKIVYYTKNERFISPWTIFILLVDFFLLGTVIFTLIQIMNEEKIYKEIPLSTFEKDIQESKTEDMSYGNNRIHDLVSDIEGNAKYDEGYTKKGIEEMIMSNGMNLTQFQTGEEIKKEKNIETVEEVPEFEKPEFQIEEKPESSEYSALKEEVFELPEENLERGVDMNMYDSIKPSEATEMFAEEDRILNGIENEPFEVSPIELPKEEEIVIADTSSQTKEENPEEEEFKSVEEEAMAASSTQEEFKPVLEIPPDEESNKNVLKPEDFETALEIDSRDFPTLDFTSERFKEEPVISEPAIIENDEKENEILSEPENAAIAAEFLKNWVRKL